MKNILSIFVVALLFTQAVDASQQFNSTNTVGISCVESSLVELPIGVMYGDYATTNVIAGITNMLVTANLQKDDKLMVWNGTSYNNYKLLSDKTWKGVRDVDGNVPKPDEELVQYGRGVWLIRSDAATREDKKVYVFGQVPVGIVTISVASGTVAKAVGTLICNPLSEDFDLNGGLIDWSASGVEKGDAIRVSLDGSTKMTGYTWDATNKKWYIISGGKKVTTGLVIPRGRGFWFSRAKGHTTGLTLTWNLTGI